MVKKEFRPSSRGFTTVSSDLHFLLWERLDLMISYDLTEDWPVVLYKDSCIFHCMSGSTWLRVESTALAEVMSVVYSIAAAIVEYFKWCSPKVHLKPEPLNVILFRNKGFATVMKLGWGHSVFRWYPYKKIHPQQEDGVKTEAETGVLQL